MLSKFKGFEKDISLEISIILASLMHDYGSKSSSYLLGWSHSKEVAKAGFHPQVIHFIEMNKSCIDERNILANKLKFRKKNYSQYLLVLDEKVQELYIFF